MPTSAHADGLDGSDMCSAGGVSVPSAHWYRWGNAYTSTASFIGTKAICTCRPRAAPIRRNMESECPS